MGFVKCSCSSFNVHVQCSCSYVLGLESFMLRIYLGRWRRTTGGSSSIRGICLFPLPLLLPPPPPPPKAGALGKGEGEAEGPVWVWVWVGD